MTEAQTTCGTTLAYKGPAFVNHSLDLRQMEDALNSLRVLLEKAAESKKEPAPNTRVRVRDGSVLLDLICVAQGPDELIASSNPGAILDLIFKMDEFVEKAGSTPTYFASLLGLAWWLKNRNIKSRKPIDKDTVQVTASDNATVNVSVTVLHMADDPDVRKAVKGLLAPLAEPKAEALEIGRTGDQPFKITRAEKSRLAIGDPDQEKTNRQYRRTLSVLHVPMAVEVVKKGKERKERFHFEDPTTKDAFWAEITDEAFMKLFRAGRSNLVYGSNLDCEIEETKEDRFDGEQAKVTKRVVLQVHGAVPPPEQTKFFDSE